MLFVGQLGESDRVGGRGGQGLLIEDIDAGPESALDGGDVLGARREHEDGIELVGGQHVVDRAVDVLEAPSPLERARVVPPGDQGAQHDIVALDEGRQLGDRGDVAGAHDADAQGGHESTSASRPFALGSSSESRRRMCSAPRRNPISGRSRSCGCHRYSYSRESTSS